MTTFFELLSQCASLIENISDRLEEEQNVKKHSHSVTKKRKLSTDSSDDEVSIITETNEIVSDSVSNCQDTSDFPSSGEIAHCEDQIAHCEDQQQKKKRKRMPRHPPVVSGQEWMSFLDDTFPTLTDHPDMQELREEILLEEEYINFGYVQRSFTKQIDTSKNKLTYLGEEVLVNLILHMTKRGYCSEKCKMLVNALNGEGFACFRCKQEVANVEPDCLCSGVQLCSSCAEQPDNECAYCKLPFIAMKNPALSYSKCGGLKICSSLIKYLLAFNIDETILSGNVDLIIHLKQKQGFWSKFPVVEWPKFLTKEEKSNHLKYFENFKSASVHSFRPVLRLVSRFIDTSALISCTECPDECPNPAIYFNDDEIFLCYDCYKTWDGELNFHNYYAGLKLNFSRSQYDNREK